MTSLKKKLTFAFFSSLFLIIGSFVWLLVGNYQPTSYLGYGLMIYSSFGSLLCVGVARSEANELTAVTQYSKNSPLAMKGFAKGRALKNLNTEKRFFSF